MATKKTPPVPPVPFPPSSIGRPTPEVPVTPEVAPPPTAASLDPSLEATVIAPESPSPEPYSAPPIPVAPVASPYVTPATAPVVPNPAAPNPYGAQLAAPYPYAAQPYGQTGLPSGLSITSMILGLVGLFLSLFGSGLLPGIAAVITGHLAARRQPHARGFWLTGLITGYVSIGIGIIVGGFILLIFIIGIASDYR